MAFCFCSFASGSSGNSYLVKTDNTVLLIDVGIAGKRILAGLEEKNIDLEEIDGIFITHEHIDHVKSLRMIGKKAVNSTVYSSEGTLNKVADKTPMGRTKKLSGIEAIQIGDITVKPFHLSHDAADPMGYSFQHGGRQISIVTDTGYITDEIFQHIKDADLLVLEANHEVNILQMGAYPYSLKRRILGDEGHLSNETAGRCICKMLEEVGHEKVPKVILAHLSKENNTPKQAYLTIRNILFEEDYYIKKDLELDIVGRDEPSSLVEV